MVVIFNKKRKKSKFEFSKMAMVFSWFMFMIWISMSYTLAFYGKDVNSEVTLGVITYCVSTCLAYFSTKTMEKHSTNKYDTDENGVPNSVAYGGVGDGGA